jgi:hypothetical protein
MGRRLLTIPAAAIAIGFGLITLAGLLLGDDLGLWSTVLAGLRSRGIDIRAISDALLQLVVITVAVTVLIGIINLITVHFGRIRQRKGGWGYSLVLIISTLAVIILTILERANVLRGSPSITTILLENVQVSIESALAGLLLFALVYGAFRTLRNRFTGWGVLFTLALLIILIAALPLPGFQLLSNARDWLMDVPVSAGARGILLGIALATVVAGVRVLTGQDRSYRE